MWNANGNRFRDGVDPEHRFLSTISQPEKAFLYFAVSLAISTAVYFALGLGVVIASVGTLPLAIVIYQTINFHHYIVDSVIWKVRRPALARELGIEGID